MPLFVTTTKNNLTYDQLSTNGHPIALNTNNKHIYFAQPGDSSKKVHDFSCQTLSISGTSSFGNASTSGEGNTGTFVRGLSVNDHTITLQIGTVTLPTDTNISVNSATETTKTIDIAVGGNFTTLTGVLAGGTHNHTLTLQPQTVTVNKETSITLGNTNTSTSTPLTFGSKFSYVSAISVGGKNNHALSFNRNTLTLPSLRTLSYDEGLTTSSYIQYIQRVTASNTGEIKYYSYNIYPGNYMSINKGYFNNDAVSVSHSTSIKSRTFSKTSNNFTSILGITSNGHGITYITENYALPNSAFDGQLQNLQIYAGNTNLTNNTTAGICYVGVATIRLTNSDNIVRIKGENTINVSICIDNTGPYINIQDEPYHAAKHTFSLSSHKFSLSQTNYDGAGSTDFTLAAGNNVTLTDDTSNRKITISATDTNTHAANHTMGVGNRSGNDGAYFRINNVNSSGGGLIDLHIIGTNGIIVSKYSDSTINIKGNNLIQYTNNQVNSVGPVKEISVVSSLPSDVASHPNTLYLIV